MKFICNNKYEFQNNSIGLPVEIQNLPGQLLIEGNTLVAKNSFHVSLVCIEQIMEKYNVSIFDFEDKVISDFCEFEKNNDVKIIKYKDFKFVSKNDKKSVVVMCEVSNLYKFFKIINEKYKLDIEYPPTHVTLYTLEGKPGIFLTDASDIKNLTKPISNPISLSL